MSGDWRSWALAAAVLTATAGAALWLVSGSPVLFIVGAVAAITSVAERTYGAPSRRPAGAGLRPTDERFVDPETGALVTVWYDPATGERRYIGDTDVG